MNKFKHWYTVAMDIDGNSEIICYEDSNNNEFIYFQENGLLNAFINADSEEHAIKKAGEIRIRFKHRSLLQT